MITKRHFTIIALVLLGGLCSGFVLANPGRGVPAVQFTAVLVAGGEPIQSDLRWSILSSKEGQAQKRKIISTTQSQPRFYLSSGNYLVKVRWGDTEVSQPIQVRAGEAVNHVIVLNAGYLRAEALLHDNGNKLKSDMRWTVKILPTKPNDQAKTIAYSLEASPVFQLSRGKYQLIADYHDARATVDVLVRAGKHTEERLSLNAGTIRLSAINAKGDKPIKQGMKWWVSATKSGIGKKEGTQAYSKEAQPTFTLPEGNYSVTGAYATAESTSVIKIRAGQRAEKSFNLHAGTLRLSGTPSLGAGKLLGGVRWWVYDNKLGDISGKKKFIAYSNRPNPTFHLMEGKYIVEGVYGKARVESEIIITKGKTVWRTMNFNAGLIRLRAILSGSNEPLRAVHWWIRDETGRAASSKDNNIAYSRNSTPKFVLPAGEYRVTVSYGQRRAHKVIQVSPGDYNEYSLEIRGN